MWTEIKVLQTVGIGKSAEHYTVAWCKLLLNANLLYVPTEIKLDAAFFKT